MGRLIPAGTGLRKYADLLVTSQNGNVIESFDAREKSKEMTPSKLHKQIIG
jgi:hypothetical protein